MTGDITTADGSMSSDDESPPAREARARQLATDVRRRFLDEGRWNGRIELERNDMMRLVRKGPKKMTKVDAQLFVYAELDRLYPAIDKPDLVSQNTQSARDGAPVVDGQIRGLGDIPGAWPELPANASLASEVVWVQANRLRVIEEHGSGPAVVHLDRALGPAPSWAALGWLETSIRSYAEYVDVAARATGGDGDESAVMRRERVAIEEVCELLEEMRGNGETCPECGQIVI